MSDELNNIDMADVSDDELLAFLEKREEQAEKRRAYAKEHGYSNTWEKQKQRMAQDPEYAAKVIEQRKAQTKKQLERMKQRMATDPEYAEKVRKQRREATKKRTEREKALLKLAKERGLVA